MSLILYSFISTPESHRLCKPCTLTVIIRKEEPAEVSEHRILVSDGCNDHIYTAHMKTGCRREKSLCTDTQHCLNEIKAFAYV